MAGRWDSVFAFRHCQNHRIRTFPGERLSPSRKSIRPAEFSAGNRAGLLRPDVERFRYRRLADKLLTEDGVSIIFGCMTSNSRKAILAALERRNGLLWYPANYEGFDIPPTSTTPARRPPAHAPAWAVPDRQVRQRYRAGRIRLHFPARDKPGSCAIWSKAPAARIVSENYVPWDPDAITLKRVNLRDSQGQAERHRLHHHRRGVRSFYQIYRDQGLDPAQWSDSEASPSRKPRSRSSVPNYAPATLPRRPISRAIIPPRRRSFARRSASVLARPNAPRSIRKRL